MNYGEFLGRIIDEGIKGAKKDYDGKSKTKRFKREGSIKGFEDCRGLSLAELSTLRIESARETQKAYREQADDYWYWRCRDAEIEWVCNVVSAAMEGSGMTGIVPVTARAVKMAASILGVEGGVLVVYDEKPGK
jgi:hypothetical protein